MGKIPDLTQIDDGERETEADQSRATGREAKDRGRKSCRSLPRRLALTRPRKQAILPVTPCDQREARRSHAFS